MLLVVAATPYADCACIVMPPVPNFAVTVFEVVSPGERFKKEVLDPFTERKAELDPALSSAVTESTTASAVLPLLGIGAVPLLQVDPKSNNDEAPTKLSEALSELDVGMEENWLYPLPAHGENKESSITAGVESGT